MIWRVAVALCFVALSGCERPCDTDYECIPGWSCSARVGRLEYVCRCTPTAEVCDGLDNDCDGVVDNAAALTSCGALQQCIGGRCACELECNGECVDSKIDTLNCGACGNDCPRVLGPGAYCQDSACTCDSLCADSCVTDFSSDPLHCGSCEHACGVGENCLNGNCFIDYEWSRWPAPTTYDGRFVRDGGVVSDTATGLLWQYATSPDAMNWNDASAYCSNLSSGGFTHGWRLPSRIELESSLDVTRQYGVGFSAYSDFSLLHPIIPASSPQADNPAAAWSLWENGYFQTTLKTAAFMGALCVRLDEVDLPIAQHNTGAPAGRYIIEADTVFDTQAQLHWQRLVSRSRFTLSEAEAFCSALSIGAETGWRVPNYYELLSLANIRSTSPSIDSLAFPGLSRLPDDNDNLLFWSSTPANSNGQPGIARAWNISFRDGMGTQMARDTLGYVRCVK